MALSFAYPTPFPSTKGWGPGWPNCQESVIVQHPVFQGGVHQRIKPLVDMLVDELRGRGYVFHPGWSWGFQCRETKGGGGGTPSFHSWGLAVDFNAPINGFGAARSDTELGGKQWVVNLMADWGFFWLGPSIGDWMHFHFCGSTEDASKFINKGTKEGLGVMLSPAQEQDIKEAAALANAIKKGLKANTFDGAGTQVAKAVNDAQAGHRHATRGADAVGAPPHPHTHGDTSKEA